MRLAVKWTHVTCIPRWTSQSTVAFEFSDALPCIPELIALNDSTPRRLYLKVWIEILLDYYDCCDRNVHMCHSSVHETRWKHVPFQPHGWLPFGSRKFYFLPVRTINSVSWRRSTASSVYFTRSSAHIVDAYGWCILSVYIRAMV